MRGEQDENRCRGRIRKAGEGRTLVLIETEGGY